MDIVEPITKFTDKLKGKAGVGKIFNVGLEEWAPGESDVDCRYDLIWIQWCAGHLTDSQLIAFLERCTVVLKEDGWIVVKENLSTSGEDVFDELDSSVTRLVVAPVQDPSILSDRDVTLYFDICSPKYKDG